MPFVHLREEGKTMKEVVEFLPKYEEGAVVIDHKLATKFEGAIAEETELEETLRTGLPKRVRGK